MMVFLLPVLVIICCYSFVIGFVKPMNFWYYNFLRKNVFTNEKCLALSDIDRVATDENNVLWSDWMRKKWAFKEEHVLMTSGMIRAVQIKIYEDWRGWIFLADCIPHGDIWTSQFDLFLADHHSPDVFFDSAIILVDPTDYQWLPSLLLPAKIHLDASRKRQTNRQQNFETRIRNAENFSEIVKDSSVPPIHVTFVLPLFHFKFLFVLLLCNLSSCFTR